MNQWDWEHGRPTDQSSLTELNTTIQLRGLPWFVVRCKLFLLLNNQRQRMRAIVKWLIQREHHRKMDGWKCGRNNAGLAGSRYVDGEIGARCCMDAWLIVIPDGTAEEEDWTEQQQHHRVTHFAWFLSRLFKSIQRDYGKISNDAPKTGTKLVGAQKTEISISAEGDFGVMKNTKTPSKSRRVGRYATIYAHIAFACPIRNQCRPSWNKQSPRLLSADLELINDQLQMHIDA